MKTSNYLKASLGFLVSAIIILGIAEALQKRKLKNCESRQSFRCPRFTCPGYAKKCGHRPWVCPDGHNSCNGTEICIGYCKKSENDCYD